MAGYWQLRLDVPYNEKDDAKALGARWDPTHKTWYAPHGIDPNKFWRWNPDNKAFVRAWDKAADGKGELWRKHERLQSAANGNAGRARRRAHGGSIR